MAFYVARTDESVLKDSQGGNYLIKSGMYPVTIDKVIVNVNDKGARHLDFLLDYNGTKSMLFGLKLDTNDGKEHFQRPLFDKLCTIAALTDISDPVEEDLVLPTNKTNQVETKQVLTDFDGLEVIVWVKERYYIWEDDIRSAMDIMGFYRASDKASAAEIQHQISAVGTQYAKDEAKADAVKYENGLTEAQVQEWIKAKRPKGTAKSTPASTDEFSTEDVPF